MMLLLGRTDRYAVPGGKTGQVLPHREGPGIRAAGYPILPRNPALSAK